VSVYSNSVGNSFLSFSFLSLSPLSSTNTSISQKPSTLTANTSSVTSSSGSSLGSTCMNAEKIKTDLQGGASICGNTSCKKTCSFSPEIKTIVNEEAKNAGVAPNIIFALMCQESSGDLAAQHRNDNSSYDCGLMQINGSSCTPEILNPRNNVHSGVLLYKMKSLAVSAYSYRSVSPENMAFASYNCCGSEGTPNARSADCNTSTGFPFDLPKWACPLNPGTSQTNMCFVRNYACEVSACLDKY